jgi:hypothetical protein
MYPSREKLVTTKMLNLRRTERTRLQELIISTAGPKGAEVKVRPHQRVKQYETFTIVNLLRAALYGM